MTNNRSRTGALLVMLTLIVLTAADRGSYGDACSKTRRCERRAWLSCFNGTCDCVKKEEMIFEPSTGTCAAKAGDRCKYAIEGPDGTTAFEQTACVTNSVCGKDGFCSCTEEFFEHSNGSCMARRGFSELCDENIKCLSQMGLSCVNGTCSCDQQSSEYSGSHCVGLAGHACIASLCTGNASCTNNTCICGSKYFQNSDNTCLPKRNYLEDCTMDGQCRTDGSTELKCLKGKCICNPINSVFGTADREESMFRCDSTDSYTLSMRLNKHHRIFGSFYNSTSESLTQCLGKVGHPCINDLCQPGSYCGKCATEVTECNCKSGRSLSSSGMCKLSHGETCEFAQPSECNDGLTCKACDGVSGCYGMKCACPFSSQTYTNNKCISPLGGPCTESSACTEEAECVVIGIGTEGQCRCKKRLIQNDNSCRLRFGEQCKRNVECDRVGKLACVEGTCQFVNAQTLGFTAL